MKLKRSTQGLLIAALILGAGVAVYEGMIAPERQAQQEQGDRLFAFAASDVQRVTIETSDRVLQFDRLEAPLNVPLNQDQDGEFTTTDWQFVRLDSSEEPDDPDESPKSSESPESPESIQGNDEQTSDDTTPEPEDPEPENLESENLESENTDVVNPADTTAKESTPARQAYIDYLFNAIEGAASDRSISAPTDRLAEYGLATPTLRLTIELKDGTRHTLDLGSRDFTQSFVYALLDTPDDATQLDVLLLPPDFINAFDRDLTAWDATIPIESEMDLPDPTIEGEAPPQADDINSEILKDPIYNPAPDNQPLTIEPESDGSGMPEAQTSE